MPRRRNISGRSRRSQFVPQSPEHNERDDIGRILGAIQRTTGSFVELLATVATTEPLGSPAAVRSGRSEIAAPTHATQFIHLAPAPRSYHARRNQIFRIATWRERWRNPSTRSMIRSSRTTSIVRSGCAARNFGSRGMTCSRAKVTAAQTRRRPVRPTPAPRATSSASSASSITRRAWS